MRELTISRYKSRFDRNKQLQIQKLQWADLMRLLGDCKRTSETFEEYMDSESLDKLGIKDVGYFVGGEFNPPLRKAGNLVSRDVLALDLDHLESWDISRIRERFGNLEYVVHSSHSHSEESPRLRIVFPFTRPVMPAEYEPIARRVAQKMGMNFFDDTTYEYSRIMFLPSASSDGDVYWDSNCGKWIDPDKLLATYEDWGDFAQWPQSDIEIEKGSLRERKDKAADPFEIPGIIGAFNRAYQIDEAIEAFDLPYEESGMGEDRYSCTLGKSADGAIFYRDDGHLFSHHESDPARGNRNAWDLVRLHRFAELDTDSPQDTPISKLPSQKAMVEFAKTLPEVLTEWDDRQKEVVAEDEFEDVTCPDTGETVTAQDSSFQSILSEIEALVEDHGKLTTKEQDSIVLKAAAGTLTGSEQVAIAHSMARAEVTAYAGVTKTSVSKDIDAKRKHLQKRADVESKDPQKEMIRHFESKYYSSGKYIERAGGVYWRYTGTHWKPTDAEIVNSGMIEAVSDITAQAESNKELHELRAAFGDKETSTVWNSLRLMYQSMTAGRTAKRAVDEDDPMGLMRTRLPAGINCNTGTIRFNDKGNFKEFPHKSKDLFTSVVPIDFDKDAECPVWDEFCKVSFQNAKEPESLQRHLEEICGYILNVSRRQRCWVMLYGPTRSGKSTVGKLLKEMMGATAKSMDMSNYDGNNSHATAGLVGKQALIEDDLKAGTMLNDSFVKMNSDEKHIGYNPKGGAEGELVSRAVIVICANNPPRTGDVSGALAERALVLPFSHTVPLAERDEFLIDKLVAEMPGVFNRFVRAFARLQARGSWEYPADATTAWEKWQGQSNPVIQFLGECYADSRDGKDRVMRPELWAHYERWAADQRLKRALNKGRFLEAMDLLWGEAEHFRDGYGWKMHSLMPGCPGTDTPEDSDFDKQETDWG